METRTNPFYELYDRLYYAAAAGTTVISEDFRLKRAIDAFEPMAQKNKVFAKLHKMCSDLLVSEKPSSDITDCLALAEALAVTQGTFLYSSETVKPFANEGFVTQDITNSRLTSLRECIAKSKHSDYIPNDLPEYANDPRLVCTYLRNCDNNSENLGKLSAVFEKACGKALVEPLFNSIDMTNPKATGRQIEFITRIAGTEQNDRYKELAFNEEAPNNVRISAISAMGLCQDNADDLIELFRTTKGKINTAVLETIAKLSPPQAEPIFEKLAGKFKAAYHDAFSLARYPVCSQYARDTLKKWYASNPKGEPNSTIVSLLTFKNDVYDCFELALREADAREINNMIYSNPAEKVLIKDILCDDKYADDYAMMIEQLYKRHPERMIFTRLILEIKRSGVVKAFEMLENDLSQHIHEVHRFVRELKTNFSEHRLYLHLYYMETPDIPVDHLPDALLRILSKVEPIEKNDPEFNCDMLRHLYVVFDNEDDEKRAIEAAYKYALLCDKYYPNKSAVEIIMYQGKTFIPGSICRMIYNTLDKKGNLPTTLYTLASGAEFGRRVYDEYCEALKMLPTMRNRYSEDVINKGCAVLRGAIQLAEPTLKRNNLL